jgi:multicomponent Na+:H+ antiporter subunit E
MLKKVIELLLLLGIWIALVWSVQIADVIAGFLVSLVAVLLFSDIFPAEVFKMFHPVRLFWFLLYIPVFLWAVVKSSLDVTYRVFHPEIPIRPGIVKVKTSLKSDIAKAFLANSITLTPGTLTIDFIGDNIYVHWINIVSEDPEVETRIIVKKFEKYLKKIFD